MTWIPATSPPDWRSLSVALGGALRLDHLRAGREARVRRAVARHVLFALRTARTIPRPIGTKATGQIITVGKANRRLNGAIDASNMRIDEMTAEAVRLRARWAELRAIADKAEALRRAAYARLSDMAASPDTRSDCLTLLREADDALNIVRGDNQISVRC